MVETYGSGFRDVLYCKLRVKVRAQISNDATRLDDVNVSSNLKRAVVLLKFGEIGAQHIPNRHCFIGVEL